MLIYIMFKSGENVRPFRDLPGNWKFVSGSQKIADNRLYTGDASYAGSIEYYKEAEEALYNYFKKYDSNAVLKGFQARFEIP